MNVIKVTPRGFCLGVVKSIKMAKDALKTYPDKKIYMIGLLVHNKIIVKELENMGIIAIDDWKKSRMEIINTIQPGSVVVFSAHGTNKEVIKAAQLRGLICIDTKCEWVLETEELIIKYLSLGYKVIFVGKLNHPETIALSTIDTKNITLVTCVEDVENLNLITKKILATNQTTLSIIDTELIYQAISKKYPFALIKNDICEATYIRQKAIIDLDPNLIDLLYVVGDQRSNNTLKLVEIAQNKNIKTLRIDSKADIDLNDLKNVRNVAVTAGASTSSIVQNQVIKFLEEF
ncbi:4-hydroxy-3-methylbut-2-enyl diphosphate reductase [Spiroplasma gladiatoris]|uniref:4-hydroxy-3-methylbut-2-enyl diphosphate reductase n=1 Tax=Spiroplasma gladiatoris TaxID=2143 RepID=A0A4V1AQB2_9MOLU|nr:4-hydroxy-3-methylbut-2-enyl diphosphate reductase [Spiroplasma gladiatoris]QBQ07889.1 4-hydroxy-3-methylbut-2-enyl diphosphate reductase [Spiroplasma gladiatoris]